MNGGLRGTKESFEVSGGLVVNLQITERMREGGKELGSQTKSRDVRCRGARLKRDKVNITKMVKEKNIFETKV